MTSFTPFRVQKFLGGLRYPVSRSEAVRWARRRGADDKVVAALRALPERRFESPIALSCAVAAGLSPEPRTPA